MEQEGVFAMRHLAALMVVICYAVAEAVELYKELRLQDADAFFIGAVKSRVKHVL